jgi:hypothetical protein
MHADATNRMQQITHDLTQAAHALRVPSVHKKTVKKRFAPSFYCFFAGGDHWGLGALEGSSSKIEARKSKPTRFGT